MSSRKPSENGHRLKDQLAAENILMDLPEGKENIFREFLMYCARKKWLKDSQVKSVLASLLKREELGSTGLGNGIAVPHAAVNGVEEPVAVLGLSRNGVDFAALDGESVHLVFLLLTPKENPASRMPLIADFCRLAKDRFVMDQLRQAKTAAEVCEILRSES